MFQQLKKPLRVILNADFEHGIKVQKFLNRKKTKFMTVFA